MKKILYLVLILLTTSMLISKTPENEIVQQGSSMIPLAVGNQWSYKKHYDYIINKKGEKEPLTPAITEYKVEILRMEKLEDILKGEDSTEFYVTIDSIVPNSTKRVLWGYAKATDGVIYMKIDKRSETRYSSEPIRFFPDNPKDNFIDKNDPEKFAWLDEKKTITTPLGTYECYQATNKNTYEYYAKGIGLIMREEIFILGTQTASSTLIDIKLIEPDSE